uniref:Uncharacterized protein n=1 Tax=Anguilla anguilla TaxID=7936 RepID=A0A0E9PFB2_ANGAN
MCNRNSGPGKVKYRMGKLQCETVRTKWHRASRSATDWNYPMAK